MKYTLFICLIASFLKISAQSNTMYDQEIHSYWISKDNSDASFQNFGIKTKIATKYLNSGKNGVLNLSANYNYVYIDYESNTSYLSDLQHFHSIGISATYYKQFHNPKWTLVGVVMPKMSSNFTESVTFNDFYINATVFLNYKKSENSCLMFGLAYTNTLGSPAPIPLISYWKKINNKWELNVGMPRASIVHHLNSKSDLAGLFELKGYNANISKDISNQAFKDNRMAQRITYRDFQTGLEYRYNLKNFQLVVNGNYTISRSFKLQNDNNKTAYKFDMNNNFSIGISIKSRL